MTGKGQISVEPNRRFRLILVAHAVWFATVCLLGAWWGNLLLRQSARIVELEAKLGVAPTASYEHTSRMITWEAGTFFLLICLGTALLAWLYWREARRARSVQAFFASVTHELRTPLTSIRLQAESIAEKLGQDKSTGRLVERLLEDTSRLESQVERTLELARVEGGGLVLSQSFLLKPWLDYFLRNWNESHGTKLAFDSQVGDLQIQADPSAVQVILKNLIDNTIRHSGRQGNEIAITLRSRENDGWVVLSYADNGQPYQGDPARLGRLFNKGASSQGAGVGLYLVSALMNRMGGRAEFRAKPGLETQLWFRQGGTSNNG